MPSRSAAIKRAGNGVVVCEVVGDKTELTSLRYHYPLCLISPKQHHKHHKVVYILGFGGGMLDGDFTFLHVHVKTGSSLTILSQASTKIYKCLSAGEAGREGRGGAFQEMTCVVDSQAFLLHLPEPVTCFDRAIYTQKQRFHVEKGGSLLLLDWMTSGRSSRGEIWDFARYCSENLVYEGENDLLIRDAWMLKQDDDGVDERNNLRKRMGNFNCVANLIMMGHRTQTLIAHLDEFAKSEKILRRGGLTSEPPIVWSVSRIRPDCMVLRAAALNTILMRSFILFHLKFLDSSLEVEGFSRI